MNLLGDIDAAIAFGRTQIGKPYDHNAAEATRYGPNVYDCSGLVTRCLEVGGMPRRHEGFGLNSADMARWGEQHPDRNIGVGAAKATFGALLIAGGVTGYGDAGHVAFSLGDGSTLESNGSRGVCIDRAGRMTWSHGVLAPTNYGDDEMSAETEQMIRDLHGWAMAQKTPANLPMGVDLFRATFDGRTPSILRDINIGVQNLTKQIAALPTGTSPVPTTLTVAVEGLRDRVDALAQHLGLD